MNLVIGSGDVNALLSGIKTKTYQDLIRKFVSETKPYYNALASPIDAFRTGAIIEDRYQLILEDGYFSQYKATCEQMNVLTSSLDFAKLDLGKVVDFDELKSIYLTDFIEIIIPIKDEDDSVYLPVIQKKFKKYYNQIQFQLLCTGLTSANLVFVAIDNYIDEENRMREIKDNEVCKLRISRDEKVISEILSRGQFFQTIKDHLTN